MADISRYLQRAADAIERRNYDLAIFNYKQALIMEPANTDAREKLRATQLRRFAEVGGNSTVATLKGMVPYLTALVTLKLLKKPMVALEHIENAITHNPENPTFLNLLIAAAVSIDKSQEDDTSMAELAIWQRGDIIKRLSPDNVDLLVEQAEAYSELERGDKAVELLQLAKKIDPGLDVDPLIRQNQAQTTSVIFEDGAKKGAHTIVASSENTKRLEAEGHIARNDIERIDKIKHIEQEVEERPKDYRLHVRIANEYYDFEDFTIGYEKGMEALQKARELMPSDTNIKVKMGDMEIKRLNYAARALRKKLDAAPNNEDIKKQYAAAVREYRQFKLTEYEQRVKAQPLIADYHHELGRLYKDTKQFDKAISEFQHSCRDPKFAINAYTELGQCFVATDQLEIAIDMYKKAMAGQEIFEKIRESLYFLADAYERIGSIKEAQQIFNQILQHDITFKDVKMRAERLRGKSA